MTTRTPDIFAPNRPSTRATFKGPELQKCSNFLIFEAESYYKTKNMVNGDIEYTSENATAAVQYALDNLTLGRSNREQVKLMGQFTISKITIPSFTTLDLTEAKITQVDATNDFLFVNSDVILGNTKIDIWGGYIDGNKSRQSASGSDDTKSIVHLRKCTDCQIVKGTYVNGNFHQIRIRDSSNVIVDGCSSKNPRHEHVSISALGNSQGASKNCRITNCHFSGVNDGTGFPGETFVSTINAEDVIIAKNVCDTTANKTSGITPNGRRTIVANNTLSNVSGSGIILSQAPEAEFDASGSIVIGNSINNNGRYAIIIDSYHSKDIIINNNIINGVTETIYAGIYVGSGHRVVMIDSNVVHDCNGSGIAVHGTATAKTKRAQYIK